MIRYSSFSCRQGVDRGFTLVEVLMALLIVGLIGTVASLRIGISPVVVIEDESNRLGRTIELAMDRSRLDRIPIIWRAGPDRYELTIRQGVSESTLTHRKLESPVRIKSVWSEGTLLTSPYELVLSGRDPGLFRIRLGNEQGRDFELRSNLLGKVEVLRVSEVK